MVKFLRILLFPFAILFFVITELRNFLFQSRIMRGARFDRPIISVGNLSTGGTGKTPMIEYLIQLLNSNEIKTGVLSRGYGRKLHGFRMVNTNSSSDECGDEPLQIKQKFPDTTVAVSEKRVDGIIHLIKESSEIQSILLDDAFQHRAVKSSFSVLTTSFEHPFFMDFILPVGNLREMRRNASRADVIVVTKCPNWMTATEENYYRRALLRYSKSPVFFSEIRYNEIRPVFETGKPISLTHNLLLVTGIASSSSLEDHVSQKAKMEHLRFGDHHRYSEKDIRKIVDLFNSFAADDKMILTTEKDAMRLRSLKEEEKNLINKLPVYYLEMKSEFIREKEKFDQLIIEHVRNFK